MSRYRQSLRDVFDAYGDDAEAGLQALANTDPPFWSEYVDAAAAKQYKADYRRHRATITASASREAVAEAAGQARLFIPPESEERIELRRVVILDGQEYDLARLSGHDGTAIAREVAYRDMKPAATVMARSRFVLRLCDHIDAETERLGRDVSFAEALGWGEGKAA